MSLDKVLEGLNKTYGQGTVHKMKDFGSSMDVELMSTGSLRVDLLLGGGIPVGRIIEIYGPESSGKTTLAIHAMAECQKNGGKAAIVDMEHAFDKFYANNLGVDTEELILSQPSYGEQAFDIGEKLIDSGEVNLLVFDSVSAMIPKKHLDGDYGDANIGVQAKMMSQGLPKLASKANNAGCTVIFINQIRIKIGIMFGSPETTSGGQALKFYASQRIDIRRKTIIKDGDIPVANEVKVKVIKNKVAPPFLEGLTQIKYGQGIYRIGEILGLAEEHGIVERSGAWYSYDGTKLGQGQAKTLLMLEDNPELLEELELFVIEAMNKEK
jgi:recombination protein RecA